MTLTQKHKDSLEARGFTRRQIGRVASILTAGAALPFYNEFAMAQEAQRRITGRAAMPPDAVRISTNENPLGPCKEGLEALYKVAPMGGRYSPNGESQDLAKTIAEVEGVKQDHVQATAGSSDPLSRSACAFTSPTRSWVMANPGYGGGAPKYIGSKVHGVPLRADYSHDVEAMIKVDPAAGVYYVCNPNNPTGSVTLRKDIDYLLANKNPNAVVVVDEAYIHYSPNAQPCGDLVAAGKDVVVLKTFSKAYGMAGIRAGYALGRPDLLAKMREYGSSGFLPITGVACATASLKVKTLIAERRSINKQARDSTFEYLEKKSIAYIPSESNCFLMEVGRPGADVAKALTEHKIYIGRVWPIWPTKVRVTVGTMEEMNKFKAAMDKVMS